MKADIHDRDNKTFTAITFQDWHRHCKRLTSTALAAFTLASPAGAEELSIPGSDNPEFVLGQLAEAFHAQQAQHRVALLPPSVTAGAPRDVEAGVAPLGRDPVAFVAAAAVSGQPWQLSFRIERYDGAQRTVFDQAAAVLDSAGRQIAVEGIPQDITDRVEAEQRTCRLAHHDVLTGLPNRRFFSEPVSPAVGRSRLTPVVHLRKPNWRFRPKADIAAWPHTVNASHLGRVPPAHHCRHAA